MLVNELKCIEVLMRTLTSSTNLDTNILSVFNDPDKYKKNKNNLFNLISIKNLITYYHENLSFSLENFLKTGTIPGIFDEKCVIPTIYDSKGDAPQDIINNIVEALSSDHYVFDDENNIYVSSSHIEASIPQVWLHRLAQASKQATYEQTYFYNKNAPKRIKNKEELIEYLRRTKSFVLTMSSSNPNANYNKDFANAKTRVDAFLKGQKEVKVEHIMDLMLRVLPREYQVEIHRHKLADKFWLITQAEELGEEFYSKPISEQEQYLNNWIVARMNSADLANLEAQKLILLADKEVNLNIRSNINANEALSGLFSLYMNIIASGNLSLETISLSDFRIKSYIPESKQILKSTRNAYSSAISHKKVTIDELRAKANELLSDIARLDLIKDFAEISAKREEYNALLEKYNKEQNTAHQLSGKREEIVEYEQSLPNNSVEEIAFDGEKLLSLINRATIKGRVYVSGKDIVIEEYNSDLPDPVFKVMININKLLDLVENINFTLEEFGTTEFTSTTTPINTSYKKVS